MCRPKPAQKPNAKHIKRTRKSFFFFVLWHSKLPNRLNGLLNTFPRQVSFNHPLSWLIRGRTRRFGCVSKPTQFCPGECPLLLSLCNVHCEEMSCNNFFAYVKWSNINLKLVRHRYRSGWSKWHSLVNVVNGKRVVETPVIILHKVIIVLFYVWVWHGRRNGFMAVVRRNLT